MREKLIRELSYSTSRSSGPGGQHVNKTDSKVTLHWNLEVSTALSESEKIRVRNKLRSRLTEAGELQMSSQASRSQAKNKEDVTERFLSLVEKSSRARKKRIRTSPSKASVERRLMEKKARSERKKDRGKPGDE